jgi:hypothetical protein
MEEARESILILMLILLEATFDYFNCIDSYLDHVQFTNLT